MISSESVSVIKKAENLTEISDEFEYLETRKGGILRCKLFFENGIPALFRA